MEIGRGLGQEEAPGALFGEGFCRPRAFMDIEIVEDHHVALPQAGRQLGAPIGIEGRSVDDPGSGKPIA